MMPTIILFGPLLGALIAGFGWRMIGEKNAMYLTTGLLFLSAFLSWILFPSIPVLPWTISTLSFTRVCRRISG